ncbi:MAG: hypothetical protein GC168_00230 [Candidatus Hydrogenedens sp.]|nr:hypothetical protein [Candidatus Hydrogenedens sp.]
MGNRQPMPETLVILGACGSSRESYWVVKDDFPDTRMVFVEDISNLREVHFPDETVPVIKDWDFTEVRERLGGGDPDSFRQYIVGMGSPRIKEMMTERARAAGLVPAPTMVSTGALVRPDARIGRGGIIYPTTIVMTNAQVGDHVVVFPRGLVGHDVEVGDFATIGAGASTAGHAIIGEGVCLGFATMVRQRLTIAPWVETGMGAIIVKDISDSGITVVGTPARRLQKHEPGSLYNP